MGMINHKFDAETTPLYFYFALKRSYEIYAVYFLLLTIHSYDGTFCFMLRSPQDGFAIFSTIMDGKPVRQALFYH